MEQELIDLLDEMRTLSHQIAHTFTLEIAEKTMDADCWARLQDGLKTVTAKSQEAFWLSAKLRGVIVNAK